MNKAQRKRLEQRLRAAGIETWVKPPPKVKKVATAST